VLLSQAFTRPVNARAGDAFQVDYVPLGAIAFRFA
jgi:2-oxo-hept-3-ene-1,7-dioate hydratase